MIIFGLNPCLRCCRRSAWNHHAFLLRLAYKDLSSKLIHVNRISLSLHAQRMLSSRFAFGSRIAKHRGASQCLALAPPSPPITSLPNATYVHPPASPLTITIFATPQLPLSVRRNLHIIPKPHVISVRQIGDSPTPSSKFHLTMSPLGVPLCHSHYQILLRFFPIIVRPCWAQHKKESQQYRMPAHFIFYSNNGSFSLAE